MSKTDCRSVFVIAEAGVNHNGDLDTGRHLVDAAAAAGADAVKFQTFRAERVVAGYAPKATYQRTRSSADEGQFEMLRRLELTPDMHHALAEHARAAGVEFMSTPFDETAASFLTDQVGVARLKVPSGEITNGPLLLHVARTGLPIILSTGASDLYEVADALGVIGFGSIAPLGAVPDVCRLSEYRHQAAAALRERVTVLHCTTEYPAPLEDANLRAIVTLRETFGLASGLSDHSRSITLPIAAVALGAAVLEKHLTLGRDMEGPDHAASLEPVELKAMIDAIREVECALGDGVKRPAASESENRTFVRRSLIALRDISRGETLGPENVGARRPGTGLAPTEIWRLTGASAERAYAVGQLIDQ